MINYIKNNIFSLQENNELKNLFTIESELTESDLTPPIELKQLDSGKVKEVFSDQSPRGRSDLVYCIAKNKLLKTSELRKEAADGTAIKNTVYLTNLQLFMESIGYQSPIANILAKNISLQFPSLKNLIDS